MAVVTRRYKLVGPTTTQLQRFAPGGSPAVLATYTMPIMDITIDNAIASSIPDLDSVMAEAGWLFDASAIDLITGLGITGDGSDGDVVIGAGTTNLNRDMYYNNLTVQAAGVLQPDQFRVFVKNILTVDVGGLIESDGGAGAATTNGGASAGGANTIAAAGPTGGAGAAGAGGAGGASGSVIQGFVGAGGTGGAGLSGANAGGVGGALTTISAAAQGLPRSLMQAIIGTNVGGNNVARISGGSGGGGGGGGAGNGAGGGAGGGYMLLIARQIINNGTIRAHGGAGGAAAQVNAGGGGGGGGGLLVIGFHSYTGAVPTVSPGLGGAGNGTGAAGNSGASGVLIQHQF